MATQCPTCGGLIRKRQDGLSAECNTCGKLFRLKPDDTKPCPFCGETIKGAAIKCRFCGENLDQPASPPVNGQPAANAPARETVLFDGTPSQWTNLGTFIGCGLVALIGVILWLVGLFGNSRDFAPTAWMGFSIVAIGVIVILSVYVKVRFTHFHVTTERIEVETGWLSKQLDHMDLFRIKDVRLTISIFDRAVGIGTVIVTSTDRSTPMLRICGIPSCRRLYDQLKQEAIRADRRRGVLHVEA